MDEKRLALMVAVANGVDLGVASARLEAAFPAAPAPAPKTVMGRSVERRAGRIVETEILADGTARQLSDVIDPAAPVATDPPLL